MNAILEKLILNRAALLIKRFDNELKQILENDLQAFKSNKFRNSSNNRRKNRLVAWSIIYSTHYPLNKKELRLEALFLFIYICELCFYNITMGIFV